MSPPSPVASVPSTEVMSPLFSSLMARPALALRSPPSPSLALVMTRLSLMSSRSPALISMRLALALPVAVAETLADCSSITGAIRLSTVGRSAAGSATVTTLLMLASLPCMISRSAAISAMLPVWPPDSSPATAPMSAPAPSSSRPRACTSIWPAAPAPKVDEFKKALPMRTSAPCTTRLPAAPLPKVLPSIWLPPSMRSRPAACSAMVPAGAAPMVALLTSARSSRLRLPPESNRMRPAAPVPKLLLSMREPPCTTRRSPASTRTSPPAPLAL